MLVCIFCSLLLLCTSKVISGDNCWDIAEKYGITVDEIEKYNFDAKTRVWKGCNNLQANAIICVSMGSAPLPEIKPDIQCGLESVGMKDCPLNVCCSGYGFCGLTSEFCDVAPELGRPCYSNCDEVSIPKCDGEQTKRVVGYYASWASRRDGFISREEVIESGFTHVIFSFAIIDQISFNIEFDHADDELQLKAFVAKAHSMGIRASIAVGGWAFSEDIPTRHIFSNLVADAGRRQAFILSVGDFLSKYGLDGIDIDFEYPAALERNGPREDIEGLSSLMEEMNEQLGPLIDKSIATPAGYWFLRGFDIARISKAVTFINVMSYDYHGSWDTDVKDSGSLAAPHTSIQDIKTTALLYVRAGIDLGKLNLGLAYYGRSYRLSDPNCSGYHCQMVGPGAAGRYTKAHGFVSDLEINEIIESNGITPSHDSSSETYYFTFQGDQYTFDTTETIMVKIGFAKQSCFGGIMVWSIDMGIYHLLNVRVGGGADEIFDSDGDNDDWEIDRSDCEASGHSMNFITHDMKPGNGKFDIPNQLGFATFLAVSIQDLLFQNRYGTEQVRNKVNAYFRSVPSDDEEFAIARDYYMATESKVDRIAVGISDEIIIAGNINSDEGKAFTEHHLNLIRTFLGQITTYECVVRIITLNPTQAMNPHAELQAIQYLKGSGGHASVGISNDACTECLEKMNFHI